VTRLLEIAGTGLLCFGLSGCALFSSTPDPLPWTGQIETHAPGTEVVEVAQAEDDSASSVDDDALPAGLTGSNPNVKSDSLFQKAVTLLPGVDIAPTQATPVQSVGSSEQPTVAELGATGWIWDDRARKWQLTAKQVPKAEEWLFETEALLFQVSAPSELNVFEGIRHATVVKVLQLDNPKVFNTLRQDPFGIADMLTQKALDPSFITEKKLYLMPDDQKTLIVDREEGTRYIGILTGYYSLDEYKLVTRLIQIPAVAQSIESGTLSKLWPLSKDETIQRPARLKLWLQLGEEQIDNVAIQVN